MGDSGRLECGLILFEAWSPSSVFRVFAKRSATFSPPHFKKCSEEKNEYEKAVLIIPLSHGERRNTGKLFVISPSPQSIF
jgi:hypothetical protein